MLETVVGSCSRAGIKILKPICPNTTNILEEGADNKRMVKKEGVGVLEISGVLSTPGSQNRH